MKVGILHYSCPPIVGGVEEVVKQQALLFSRNEIKVKVFAGKGKKFAENVEVEINFLLSSVNPEVKSSTEELLRGDKRRFSILKDKIKRYLKEKFSDFDCVILHNVLSMGYNLPLTYALNELSKEIKFLAWNHDSPYFYEDIGKHFFKEPYTILKRFNGEIHYVTISESRRSEFAKLYGVKEKRINVIKNGIDPITFFRLSDLSVKIILEKNLFEADFIMFLPSRLHPRKNIELSIYVLSELRRMGLNAMLLITGAFDPHEERSVLYLEKLKNIVMELNLDEYVIFLEGFSFKNGEVIHSDRIKTRDLYLISDILFLPSFKEGFGIPLLEASMIKLPVVCSDIPPFREIGGDNVLYIDPFGNPSEIAKQILKFRSEYGVYSFFRRTIKEYTWDNIFKRDLFPLLERISMR